MKKLFTPTWCINSIYSIASEDIKKHHIKGLIVDLDNTLLAWNVLEHTEQLREWAESILKEGIQIFILSNNNHLRVKKIAQPLNIPYKATALKPSRRNFRLAMEQMNLEPEETLVIGDQIMTDVVGANRLGLKVVLVKPIVNHDNIYTVVNRTLEKTILRKVGIDPKKDWGDSLD